VTTRTPQLLWLEDDRALAVAEAAGRLAAGGVVVFPTDTVYGLLGLSASAEAFHELYRLKGRAEQRPLQLLVAAMSTFASQVQLLLTPHGSLRDDFRGGRLTVVVGERVLSGLPRQVGELQPGPVGVRCPAHPELQQVLDAVGAGLPLWATSANPSGSPACADAAAVQSWLASSPVQPALVALSRQPTAGVPSRVVRLENGAVTNLR